MKFKATTLTTDQQANDGDKGRGSGAWLQRHPGIAKKLQKAQATEKATPHRCYLDDLYVNRKKRFQLHLRPFIESLGKSKSQSCMIVQCSHT